MENIPKFPLFFKRASQYVGGKLLDYLFESCHLSTGQLLLLPAGNSTIPSISGHYSVPHLQISVCHTVCHTYLGEKLLMWHTLSFIPECATLRNLYLPHLEICVYQTISVCHTYICGKLDCTELGNMTHFEVRYYTSVWHPYLFGKPFDLAHFICV